MFPLCLCFICRWFGVRFDGSYRPTQTSASTDADIRIDRRRHPYRPTQMSVSTDADSISTKKNRARWVYTCSVFIYCISKNEVLSLNYQGVSRQYPGFS